MTIFEYLKCYSHFGDHIPYFPLFGCDVGFWVKKTNEKTYSSGMHYKITCTVLLQFVASVGWFAVFAPELTLFGPLFPGLFASMLFELLE